MLLICFKLSLRRGTEAEESERKTEKALDLFSLMTKLRGYLITAFQSLKSSYKGGEGSLFTRS